MKEALTLALEVLEDWGSPLALPAIIAIKEALAQPDYRAVKTYHEGKPVYVSQTEFPPECKTVAEQTAYAFGWWKALESVRIEQPAQEPVAQWQKRHRLWTEGAWENAEEHDAKQWRDKAQGWEIRALYTIPPAAQPAQEPVGHRVGFWCADLTCNKCYSAEFRFKHTTPQQRPWVGLTDEERNGIYNQCQGVKVGSAISLTEAKLKEKNT